ncbi:energy-coupling factor ABC transporter substrate-binding protein [Ferribacterium limneticum]|uniref:energy-coupling factor ABC transporter substrate-binding protein n=1 Tax=Ferribacterium limneticum TaxID=76259 RepID=UPI001CFC11BD|nr:energy-coupling factor ABC transporter substrate-binding protein [Ferribacterium limneticum]UCV28344.1 energy-coupling factor ABC transporter substrate-binding protein [Ferribacterium limneticum]UCV32261.1 energy-coupling factor ABC transporter substrate-binding protein [Ferribacterium limneticum]
MKKQNWLLIAAVVLLTALPLWLVPHLGIGTAAGPDGQPAATFGGADAQAQQAIVQIAPNYQPWFAPLLEPASGEIASLLFALQAALGAGVIGYWLGSVVTRERLLKEAERRAAEAGKDHRAD